MSENKQGQELSEKELSNVAGGKNQERPGGGLGDSVSALRNRSNDAVEGDQERERYVRRDNHTGPDGR